MIFNSEIAACKLFDFLLYSLQKRKIINQTMHATTHYLEEFYLYDSYLIVQKWTPIRPWYQRMLLF